MHAQIICERHWFNATCHINPLLRIIWSSPSADDNRPCKTCTIHEQPTCHLSHGASKKDRQKFPRPIPLPLTRWAAWIRHWVLSSRVYIQFIRCWSPNKKKNGIIVVHATKHLFNGVWTESWRSIFPLVNLAPVHIGTTRLKLFSNLNPKDIRW